MMRVLGVDFGERRIGLAISDPSGLIAQTWGIIERASDAQAAERVAQVAGELGAETILLGLPLTAGEAEGAQARRVRRFGALLGEKTSIPIVYWDETLTSVDAMRLLYERGTRRGRRRQPVDAIAAAVLLQAYLDVQPARSERM